ncbi:MAG: hypothetical protein KGY42_07035 [Desulfobacterales bacterium]|nr:hypothetical protein [Desulfobacterales bacterium]MBS3754204.1 hypothetical protein [Desulfobacterales bacterium]
MQKQVWNGLAAVLAVFAVLMISGCAPGTRVVLEHDPGYPDHRERKYEHHEDRGGPPPWAPAHGYRAKKYRYYPSAQVYFDTQRDVYFYYRDGDWRVSASLPGRIRVNMGDHVTLEMGTDRPYRYHSEVVRHYPPGHDKGGNRGRGRDKEKHHRE